MWYAGFIGAAHLLWAMPQAESFCRLANAVVEAEQLESGYGRPGN